MGMPIILSKTKDEAKTDIINSVALMQAGIFNIIDMEGKKLQSAAGTNVDDTDYKLRANTIDELLKVNDSVENTISSLTMLQSLLDRKLALVTDGN